MTTGEIQIRSCETHDEFQECVELQRTAWQFQDLDLVPKEIFIVAAKTGGQVCGAYDGDRLVGFALAMPAVREGRIYIHSHMLAVESSYRDRGIGRKLKLHQRTEALNAGIDLMEWTFDPLALKNAYINIMRLGTIMRRYVRNLYGETSSPLHAGAPTDRLVAEWELDLPRVKTLLANETTEGERRATVAVKMEVQIEAEIPVTNDIDKLRHNDPAAARSILHRVRESFERSFTEGLAVTGFRRDKKEGVYLLTRYED